jgi:hypothetical protein
MTFKVHAEQHRSLVACECATAAQAIAKACDLMGAGATGLYIYDHELDDTYWPHMFVELLKYGPHAAKRAQHLQSRR